MKQTNFGEIVNYENGNTRFRHNIPLLPENVASALTHDLEQ